MGDDRRIFEYFVVAGLPETPEELNPGAQECGFKNSPPQPPITDICVIFPGFGEQVPENFTCVETTPTGLPADLNHGSIRTQSCYICYRRGYHKPPLVDIGVLYDGRGERVVVDSQIIKTTPFGRPANVNNGSQGIYLTYRRAPDTANSNLLAVTDICVIIGSKGETAPHTFYKIDKNLNKGMMGSDVFICYKKSMANCNRIVYKPSILDRFPLEDYDDYPLPSSVPIFGLPMGAVIGCWPAKCQAPGRQFLTFVLTDHKGHKLYGAAVVFYEPYDRPVTAEQLERLGLNADPQQRTGNCSDSGSTNDPAELMTFNTNKCICLVSRYPFFNAFRRYLFYLHRMAVTGEYALPIERYISHLLYEVPFPTSMRPRILVQIGIESICFDNPEDSPLPLSGANFYDFIKLLGVEHGMYLMLLVMMEQKILIHSLRPWYLTSVAEALCSLLFPFHWQCPYIPQCPLDLAGVLHAPLPFIAGVDSRYFELYEDPPKDVTCVDLDTSTISQSEIRQKFKLGMLPRKASKALRQQIEILSAKVAEAEFQINNARSQQGIVPVDVDLQNLKRRRALEHEIQEAFLRFMVQILKGYQTYLKPIRSAPSVGATDLDSLFDVNGFLRSRDKSGLDFYKQLVNTQLFIRFIEERSLLSDKDKNAYLAFFDEYVTKVETLGDHVDNTRLLEFEVVTSSDRTSVFSPPEPASLDTVYSYKGRFPKLSLDRFSLDHLVSDTGQLLRTPRQFTTFAQSSLVARRTKQEAKAALRLAKQQRDVSPLAWAKCILSYAYSLWYIHLPAYAKVSTSKQRALRDAYNVLDRMQNADLKCVLDEVCYRILIHVCGTLGQPVMAVKVFLNMKRQGIQPNAITYGFYNRAVLEAQWPSTTTLSAQKYWAKIRCSVRAIALFKRACRERQRARRTLSQYSAESGDFYSQVSLASQTRRSASDIASGSTVVSNDAAASGEPSDDRCADLGYHSQVNEDSVSTVTESLDSTKTPSTSKRAKLTALNLSTFDEIYRKNRAIVTQSPLRSSLSSYESAAGLLITTDISKLDDSVFTNSEKSANVKRLRHRSLTTDSPCTRPVKPTKLFHSFSDTCATEKEETISPSILEIQGPENEQTEMHTLTDGALDRKNMKLGNIPEEGHVETEEDANADPLGASRRSHSRSPTKAVRMSITDNSDPLLGSTVKDDPPAPADTISSTPDELTTPKIKPVLLEKQPFEDELKQTPRTPLDSSSPGGNSFLGFSNLGRNSVRGFWNKINNAAPMARLSKSHTVDVNLQSPTMAASQQMVVDSPNLQSPQTPLQNAPSAGTLSPTLSHLVNQGAKMISRVDGQFRSSDSFTRLKAGMSSVVKSFKGNLEQQLASPIRGSLSSLSLGDASGLGYGAPPLSASSTMENGMRYGEDSSSLNEEGGGIWFHHLDEAGNNMVIQDMQRDPAFQLSSGETGSLLSYDFVAGAGRSFDVDSTSTSANADATVLEVLLCTATRCGQCGKMLYDEEIMAGWTADDSDLNTFCQFCGGKLVPHLQVVVRQQHLLPSDSWYSTSKTSSLKREKTKVSTVHATPAGSNSIQRRGSFTSQNVRSTCDTNSDQKITSAAPMSASLETLPSSCTSEISQISADENGKTDTSSPSGTRRRAGSDLERSSSLLREAVGRRLFMDAASKNVDHQNHEENNNKNETDSTILTTHSVPFLSPFVLRKEVENVLATEGEDVMISVNFMRKHNILYWNLLYLFRRLAVPTHFIGWLRSEYCCEKIDHSPTEETPTQPKCCANTQICVRCVYDLAFLHEEKFDFCKPIYLSAQQNVNNDAHCSQLIHALLVENRSTVPRSVVAQMLEYLAQPNLHKPILILINEHRKRSTPAGGHDLPKHFSIYRDVLFLALLHFGRGVRRDYFDREYVAAFAKLSPIIAAKLSIDDRPPCPTTRACRKIFIPLDLC